MVADAIDRFRIDHDLAKADKIGNVLTDFDLLVDHIEFSLLLASDAL